MRVTGLVLLLAGALCAQDIAGDWQGTLKQDPQDLRLIIRIDKGGDAGWRATLFSIDESPDRGSGVLATSVTMQGSVLKLASDTIPGVYQGTVSKGASSIAGNWTQNRGPRPLELERATQETAWGDPSPHKVQTVTVDKDVKLEVLDWGGSGRPLVLLAGLGNTAHMFDRLAPKLTDTHRVYGITRRGYGASSVPATGYSADRLGDDVLAVLDALKLDRPVLVGHSIAGEELSSVGTRRPEKIAGLVYLDAGYGYAYYDRARGDFAVDLAELKRKLEQLQTGNGDPKPLIQDLLESIVPAFERDLRDRLKLLQSEPARSASAGREASAVEKAIFAGAQKYTDIRVPILAIYAVPRPSPAILNDPAALSAFEALDANREAQVKAFESGVPSARVVRLPGASHFVYLSNEADVIREINVFLSSLPGVP